MARSPISTAPPGAEVQGCPGRTGVSGGSLAPQQRRRGPHLSQPPLSHRSGHAHRPPPGAAALGAGGPGAGHPGGRLRQRVPLCRPSHPPCFPSTAASRWSISTPFPRPSPPPYVSASWSCPRRLLADFRRSWAFTPAPSPPSSSTPWPSSSPAAGMKSTLSRMRKHYRQKRDAVIAAVYKKPAGPPMPPSPRRMRACISCCGWTVRRRTRHSAVRRSSAVSVWPCCPITTSGPRTLPSTCWWSTIPASTWTGFPPPWSVLPPYGRRMTMYDELTRADLQKMQEEIDYRVQQLPQADRGCPDRPGLRRPSENFSTSAPSRRKTATTPASATSSG